MHDSKPFRFGSTFAERKTAREAEASAPDTKQVESTEDAVEDKAIKTSVAKRSGRKR